MQFTVLSKERPDLFCEVTMEDKQICTFYSMVAKDTDISRTLITISFCEVVKCENFVVPRKLVEEDMLHGHLKF